MRSSARNSPAGSRVDTTMPRLPLALLAVASSVAIAAPSSPLHVPSADDLARARWLAADAHVRTLADSFAPPAEFRRVAVADGSFGAWLRQLPLRAPGSPVRAFDGELIHAGDDPRVAAVAELDVGARDLQQCADSIIRLDAEWRFAAGHGAQISYPIGHGSKLQWTRWAAGERPRISDDDRVTWRRGARADDSHAQLRAFLDVVFGWAGTATLEDGTRRVPRAQLRPGDFFVLGGHPGHAVLVLDVVEDGAGHRRALLGQGYMPAQDFHVLAHDGDPWFSLDGDTVVTPFWRPFPWTALHRLPV
jgi:hypothetical protein